MGRLSIQLHREHGTQDAPAGSRGMVWISIPDREIDNIVEAIASNDKATVARAIVRVIDPDPRK